MSNLSEFLNLFGETDSKALGFVGSTVGVLADFSGAAGAIGSLVEIGTFNQDTAELISLLDDVKNTLQHVLNAIDQTNARGRWQDISNRWGQIDDAFAQANSVLDNLQDDKAHIAQLDFNARSSRVQQCAITIEHLLVKERWYLFSDDLGYYEDHWNSRMAPSVEDDAGSVYCPNYVMPQLLNAIAIYLEVIRALLPDDISQHTNDLQRFRNFLVTNHDKSRDGIRTMGYPDLSDIPDNDERSWTGELIYNARVPAWTMGYWDNNGQPHTLDDGAYYDDGVDYYQPFGAIHIYSGANAYDKFPPIPVDPNNPTRALDSPGFLIKLALATRARWKDIYQAIGLSVVWDTIEQLGRLTNAAPLGLDAGRWWTLREIHSIAQRPEKTGAPGAQLAWLSDGAPLSTPTDIKFRDTLVNLYGLYGMPTINSLNPGQPIILSVRAVLDAATLRAKVPPGQLSKWWGYLSNPLQAP